MGGGGGSRILIIWNPPQKTCAASLAPAVWQRLAPNLITTLRDPRCVGARPRIRRVLTPNSRTPCSTPNTGDDRSKMLTLRNSAATVQYDRATFLCIYLRFFVLHVIVTPSYTLAPSSVAVFNFTRAPRHRLQLLLILSKQRGGVFRMPRQWLRPLRLLHSAVFDRCAQPGMAASAQRFPPAALSARSGAPAQRAGAAFRRSARRLRKASRAFLRHSMQAAHHCTAKCAFAASSPSRPGWRA